MTVHNASKGDERPEVTAVVVNYNTGELTRQLVGSLLDQVFSSESGGPGRLEVVIHDNASPSDQREHLEPLASPRVHVTYGKHNLGYAGAVNTEVARARGRFVLILNSDVIVLQGAVEAMIERLRQRSRTGVVGPLGSLDIDGFWRLPAFSVPTLSGFAAEALAQRFRAWARYRSRGMARRSHRFWTSTAPFRWSAVAGFALMMRTVEAQQLGPFDEVFPLYFEDGDLCRRVRGAGLDLEIVPDAAVVHLYDRSARQFRAEAEARHRLAEERYYRRHYGAFGASLQRRLSAFAVKARTARPWNQLAPMENLGVLETPPEIGLPTDGPWLAQLGVEPLFLWTAGHRGEGRRFKMPDSAWHGLHEAHYFLRFLDPEEFDTKATFMFHKTCPARSGVRQLA